MRAHARSPSIMSFSPSLKKVMSPRDFARVIGVSESSVKRWIDAGEIPARVTRGGHRRVDFLPALKALEKTGRRAVKPSFLGLSPETADSLQDPEAFANRLFRALHQGDGQEAANMILASVIAGSHQPADEHALLEPQKQTHPKRQCQGRHKPRISLGDFET